jgi:hypothetical protein
MRRGVVERAFRLYVLWVFIRLVFLRRARVALTGFRLSKHLATTKAPNPIVAVVRKSWRDSG